MPFAARQGYPTVAARLQGLVDYLKANQAGFAMQRLDSYISVGAAVAAVSVAMAASGLTVPVMRAGFLDASDYVDALVTAANGGSTGGGGGGGATITAPVTDWRAVTLGVTDLAGTADTNMQAQQASTSTKTRGASFSVSSAAPTGRIFKVAAHAQELQLYWWGLGGNATSTVEVSTNGGANWADTGFTDLKLSGGTINDRMQAVAIAPGGAKWIRLTCSTSSSTYTVWPQLHEKPATGLAPVFLVCGNSIPHYHLAGDTSGSPSTNASSFMNACMAAAGGDPIIMLVSEPGAVIDTLQGHLTSALAQWGKFATTAYLCAVMGGNATTQRPYTSDQKPPLDAALNTYFNQVKAAGLQVVMDDISFMFQDDAPFSTLLDQSQGRGPYNVNVLWPWIAANVPDSFNTALGVAEGSLHFWSMYRSADLGDGRHPNTDAFQAWQSYHANSWYKRVMTGAWGTHQVYQRINTVEATLLQADYDWLQPMFNILPASAAKTAIVARQAAVLPLVLLKTANLAVATLEASHTSTDKTAAQAAVAAAVSGGASTSTVSTAYGNTVNLAGTTALTARINAVSTLTVSKRVKVANGATTTSGPGFNAAATTSTYPIALLDDVGGVSGFSLASTTGSGNSTTGGSGVAVGTAPNAFPGGSVMGKYQVKTSGPLSFVFTGLDTTGTKFYRPYAAVGLSGATDRSMTCSIVGATTQTSGIKNPASNNSVIFDTSDGLTGVHATAGGQITVTMTGAGGNTTTYLNGLILEEYT